MRQRNDSPGVKPPSWLRRVSLVLKFYWGFINRWIRIAFKRNRKLHINELRYHKLWRFDNAYLYIYINASNAIWMRVGTRRFAHQQPTIIIDLSKVKSQSITIEVFGFRQHKQLLVDLTANETLESQNFLPKITDFKGIQIADTSVMICNDQLKLTVNKPTIIKQEIIPIRSNVKLSPHPFKMSDYI